ncbi:hypothetical protein [Nostoc sp. UHCC 0870]|nr:hypothetical protein L6494_04280 [Nostoc sp. UHCC 0870]
MIDANQYIFDVLANFVQESNQGIYIPPNKRCIETDQEEKEWLQKLKIIKIKQILPDFKTSSFGFDNINYFAVSGWTNSSEIKYENLDLIELNAGIVTALIFEFKLTVGKNIDAYTIAEQVFYESDEEIIKYQYTQILKFFAPLSVYRISNNFPLTNIIDSDIAKLSGFFIIKNPQIQFLKFSRETKEYFERIFLEGANSIPYDNLLFSLVAVYWRYSFLDIYRCIERLFPIFFLEELHNKLQIKTSLLDFSSNIEKYIGWKPKESDAINYLMDKSPEDAIAIFKEIKKFIDGNEEGKSGDIVYKIRNSIVHFRPVNEYVDLDDKQWDNMILACLYVIEYWYAKYDTQINS